MQHFLKGDLESDIFLHLAPLAPQFWGELELLASPCIGEPEFKVPQYWGMRGGKNASDTNQRTFVYAHLWLNLKMLHFAPLAPQFWGEQDLEQDLFKSPSIGGFRGLLKTCVYINLPIHLKILHLAPLAPQFWGNKI